MTKRRLGSTAKENKFSHGFEINDDRKNNCGVNGGGKQVLKLWAETIISR